MRQLFRGKFISVSLVFSLIVFILPFYTASAATNLASNPGFETGSLSPWGNWNASVVNNNQHSGSYAVKVGNGGVGSSEQVVTVQPYSKYSLSAYVKTASGSDEVRLGVKNYGGSEIYVSSALVDYTQVSLDFSTGAGTGATIYIYYPRGSLNAWGDDVSLTYVGPSDQAVTEPRNLPIRVPTTDMGISQLPNSSLSWYQDAKFGMFIHWGVYAGPAQGEWYMENAAIPISDYANFAQPSSGTSYFAADQFDANAWAQLAKDAGMQFMNLTTRHHEGYALFPSQYPNAWTSMQTHGRDFVGEYVQAARSKGLKVGFYYSPMSWRYPGLFDVYGTGVKPNKWGYTTDIAHKENARQMKEEVYEQVKYLMTHYGQIDHFYWDGGWLGQSGTDRDAAFFWEPGQYRDPNNQWSIDPAYSDTDSTGKPLGLMGMVRKYQPNMIVNARSGWMGDISDEEGGQTVNGPIRRNGEIYQKDVTMANGPWGYKDNVTYMSYDGVIRLLADSVVRNMTLLLNVGPDRHGVIPATVQTTLRDVGTFLSKVGESVYGTRGGPWQPVDGQYGYTYKDNKIYIHILPGYAGTTFTTPPLGADVANAVYNVYDKTSLSFVTNADGSITISGLNRIQHNADTVVGITLNSNVQFNPISFSSSEAYIIVSKHSGKALDVRGASLTDGANIVQNTRNEKIILTQNSFVDNQLWYIIPAGNGLYKIKNKKSGKLLDNSNASTADGNPIIQWYDNGGLNQLWSIIDIGGGYFKLQNAQSLKMLDLYNGSQADDAIIDGYHDINHTTQQWAIMRAQ